MEGNLDDIELAMQDDLNDSLLLDEALDDLMGEELPEFSDSDLELTPNVAVLPSQPITGSHSYANGYAFLQHSRISIH